MQPLVLGFWPLASPVASPLASPLATCGYSNMAGSPRPMLEIDCHLDTHLCCRRAKWVSPFFAATRFHPGVFLVFGVLYNQNKRKKRIKIFWPYPDLNRGYRLQRAMC